MFALGAATRIYVATGNTDMRIGFDGLWGKIRDVLGCDPASGHIFLFANSRRNRLKLVFFDGSGLWVCSKRMEGVVYTGRRPRATRSGCSLAGSILCC
jgi:transposase